MTAVLLGVVGGVQIAVVLAFLLTRFGVLAWIPMGLVNFLPLTADPASPFFTASLISVVVMLALAIFAFRVSLAGHPLFRQGNISP
jgi:hypothetical protein